MNKKIMNRVCSFLFVFIVLLSYNLFAGFTINNSTLTLNNNFSFRLAGSSGSIILNSGTLSCSSAKITLEGNWTNQGSFTAGASTVTFENAGSTTTLSGSTTFYNLICMTPGKSIIFTVGSTQTVTNIINLTGTALNPIMLRSSINGNKWAISFTNSSQTADYINVQDSEALLNTITCNNSSDSGNNNVNWILAILGVSANWSITFTTPTYNANSDFNIYPTSITITNTGNAAQRYILSCSTATDLEAPIADWTVVGSTPSNNTEFRAMALFTVNTMFPPSVSDYSVAFDTVTTTQQLSGLSDPAPYVGDQTGRNVPASEARALWIAVTPPRSNPSDADPSEHRFYITITAEQE